MIEKAAAATGKAVNCGIGFPLATGLCIGSVILEDFNHFERIDLQIAHEEFMERFCAALVGLRMLIPDQTRQHVAGYFALSPQQIARQIVAPASLGIG